jgi:hypothetical protein
MTIAALPCFGHGNLSVAGITAGSVVVVVVVDVEGIVVVVVDKIVVVVVSRGTVVERAISGVATTNVEIKRPPRDTTSSGPRRRKDRGVDFTQLPYFAGSTVFVTAP